MNSRTAVGLGLLALGVLVWMVTPRNVTWGNHHYLRHWLTYGLIAVNKRRTDIPSAMVKVNDQVAFTSVGSKTEYAKTLQESIKSKQPPAWLSLDMAALNGRVIGAPTIEGAESIFDPNVVVEYYSR